MDLEVSPSFSRTLAKLYLLDDDNEWIDQGTGYPSVENVGVNLRNLQIFLQFLRKKAIFCDLSQKTPTRSCIP